VKDNQTAISILIETLKVNPELWETRKKTAEILYNEGQYVEAAEVLWGAPEIPSTDTDVAFVIKLVSRAQPNRAIRMIYEIVRRNNGKPAKNMAVARALNDIGMYMQAARFYGAALASDPSLFDLGFERQALWLDDSRRLIEEWEKTDQAFKPPLNVPSQDIHGGTITPYDIPDNIAGYEFGDNIQAAQETVTTVAAKPLLVHSQLARPTATPTATLAVANRTETMVTPAPVRTATRFTTPPPAHAHGQPIPTQPLQVATVRALPSTAITNPENAPAAPYTALATNSDKLLKPTTTNRPQFKFQ
jgi:hypothetical protein